MKSCLVGKKQFPRQPVLPNYKWWPITSFLLSFFLTVFRYFSIFPDPPPLETAGSSTCSLQRLSVWRRHQETGRVGPRKGLDPICSWRRPGRAVQNDLQQNSLEMLLPKCVWGFHVTAHHILVGLHVLSRGTLTAARQQHKRLRTHAGLRFFIHDQTCGCVFGAGLTIKLFQHKT